MQKVSVVSRWSAVLIIVLGLTLPCPFVWAAPQDKPRWEEKYREDTYRFGKDPIPFLREHVALLPKGTALDLAMGEGRNAVFLAAHGFDVLGVDISERALQKAHALADEQGVSLRTQQVDLDTYELPPETYDVIVCTYYLQPSLFSGMQKALKRGGMVVVETYTHEHVKYRPEFNRAYLLKTNELLDFFRDFKILRYQVRDDGQGVFASLLAQKP